MPILTLKQPEGFSFRSTVYSHGWSELRPFELDVSRWRLTYVFTNETGTKASLGTIFEKRGKIFLDLFDDKVPAEKALRDTAHILRLDDDLTGFYEVVVKHGAVPWAAERGAGRLLRSPTVFEDLVKTICTTNCSWGLTKIMVTNLVEKLGIRAQGGSRAFPTAKAMASVDEDFYRDEIRAGYRSPYIVELAQRVASGELHPQNWLTSELPTPELKKEMKKVKGVGDYAAENLLKLVGRYDGLALDSWLRSQFYKRHNNEKPCRDKKIERHYSKFGEWRGLVIWCDMTEKWIADI
ncbi:MAG: DNA-3-methyladenine glycosylase 2 family protein [Acidobacteria bacterium]|nr:DNA-3-methyladenine glycosylase 2 family protein [Acidobacteriota bacterium]